MCLVKGGRFMMGGGPRAPEPTPHEVTVGDFYIDQFEVTTAQAVLFLNAHGNTCHGLDKYQKDAIVLDADQCVNSIEGEHSKIYYQGIVEHDGHFEVRPGYEETPETDFTFEGAMRYCEWVGKQVPSSAEWEYAARHDPVTQRDFVYPWGDRWLANHAACSPCARNALAVGIFDGTHGHGDGSSPWGAHDMAGGTSELVFACADPNETCHAGSPCPCQILSAGGRTDHDITWQTTSARSVESDSGDQGVRCLLPKTR